MRVPGDELRTLFDTECGPIAAEADFEERLKEAIQRRRQRRVAGVLSASVLCAVMAVFLWVPQTAPESASPSAWLASLDEIWTDYEVEHDALLEEGDWTEEDEWPSDYLVLAQLIDETEETETVQ